MRAACFCGALFEDDGDIVCCPECGAPAILPRVVPSRVREEMEAEVARILDDPASAGPTF